MENSNENQTLWEILPIILKHVFSKLNIIILTALAVAIFTDLFFTKNYMPLYECKSTLAIRTNVTKNSNDDESSEIATAFGYLISSNIFKNQMLNNIDLDMSGSYFKTSVLPDTDIIVISAVSTNLKTSYKMMHYVASHYQEIAQQILGDVNVDVLQDCVLQDKPANALNHQKTLLLYGGGTFVLMCALVALIAFFKDTIKTKEDIQEKLQLSVFGTVPKEKVKFLKKKKSHLLITDLTTSFQYVEVYKKMRVKLEEKCKKHQHKVILVTSTRENEGKSSTVANLALALVQNDQKVLVIDADLRKPSQQRIFDIQVKHSFKNYLDGEIGLEEVIYHHEKNEIDFVLGNSSMKNIMDVSESEQLEALIQYARENYDYVLIDTPPAGYFNDAISFSNYADGLIFVCRQDFAYVEDINMMISKMAMSQKDILGVIFNQKLQPLLSRAVGYHSYRYGYSYGYGYYGHYGHYSKKRDS